MSKRLTRDKEQAMVAGVLAGMARYFKQDPALFRIFAIVFLILTGIFPGLLFYLAAWVFMPKSDSSDDETVEYRVVD